MRERKRDTEMVSINQANGEEGVPMGVLFVTEKKTDRAVETIREGEQRSG